MLDDSQITLDDSAVVERAHDHDVASMALGAAERRAAEAEEREMTTRASLDKLKERAKAFAEQARENEAAAQASLKDKELAMERLQQRAREFAEQTKGQLAEEKGKCAELEAKCTVQEDKLARLEARCASQKAELAAAASAAASRALGSTRTSCRCSPTTSST